MQMPLVSTQKITLPGRKVHSKDNHTGPASSCFSWVDMAMSALI
jgi:hypothetical protein